MTEESLISPPPRDSLILLRRDIQEEIKAQKNKEKQKSALAAWHGELRHFSRRFFSKDGVFETLTEAQKDELAKLCASFCKKRIALISAPFAALLIGVLSLGVIAHWTLFFLLIPWFILTGFVFFGLSNWIEYIEFLFARKTIKKLDKEKNLPKGNENG